MSILSSFWDEFLLSFGKDQKAIPFLFSFLKQLHPVELTEDSITLGCQNPPVKLFLDKRTRDVEDLISTYAKKKMSVEFVVMAAKKRQKDTPLLSYQPSLNDIFFRSGLHAKYSFDNFAVSTTNQVAFAAAQAVTNGLGSTYNPLFLHGGVGVGKTHLAQSVGRTILERNQENKVFFCPADQFVNELIESIREKSTPRFRRKYRYLQLLIVDDIQFIAGKQAVQEEFFHTFNTIVSAGGQLILTSDRPPQEIKNLEDRLRSRFSGGLTVDIQPPDFELRTAILLIKAKEKNIEIDIEAAKIIADQVADSRALEGTLLSIYTLALGTKERIDLELIDRFFSKKKVEAIKKTSPEDVLKAVCSFYNMKISHIKGESRASNVVLPRQIAMFILRNHLRLRLEEVAYLLKKKDHTTVMHAIEKISRLIIKDALIKNEVDQITRSLNLST